MKRFLLFRPKRGERDFPLPVFFKWCRVLTVLVLRLCAAACVFRQPCPRAPCIQQLNLVEQREPQTAEEFHLKSQVRLIPSRPRGGKASASR